MIAATSANFARAPRRLGVSILEFVGCLSAMVGGVVLGSIYLGVDVKEVAYSALERVHVVDRRPPDVEEPKSGGDRPTPEPTEGQASATGSHESAASVPIVPASTPSGEDQAPATAPTREVQDPAAASASGSDQGTQPAPPAPPAPPPAGFFAREDLITEEQREALTRAYWDALAGCMKDEVSSRVPAIDAEGNWQLFDYLSGRRDGHQKAAEDIAQLDSRGVDDHVLAYAKKALAWHEDGAKLFGRALALLTDAPTAQLSGPFAQSWQSASTQHRMEARLLVEKQQAVQSYLDHAYQPEAPAEAVQ